MTTWLTTRAVLLAALLPLAACGGDDPDEGSKVPGNPRTGSVSDGGATSSAGSGGTTRPGGGNGSGSGGFTGASGSQSGGGGGPSVPTGGEECRGLPPVGAEADAGEPCVGTEVEAESVPVDMYILMDRSISMNEPLEEGGTTSRWNGVREAVQRFVTSEEAAGVGVGLDFFPASSGGNRNDEIDCNQDQYSDPTVPIGMLPDVGSEVVAAMDSGTRGGFTPTLPALAGAVKYAKQWATDHPDRASVVVLVTDGLPTICQSTGSISAIADIAKEAYETDPRVLTFVVGLAAPSNLNTIARGGGTRNAFLIESGDITERFLDTILRISRTPLTCDFEIPEPPSSVEQIDFDKVTVKYTPEGGEVEEIPIVTYASDCNRSESGGFYFDNPTAPTRIRICPCSCNRFGAGRVEIGLGCEPRPGVIQ